MPIYSIPTPAPGKKALQGITSVKGRKKNLRFLIGFFAVCALAALAAYVTLADFSPASDRVVLASRAASTPAPEARQGSFTGEPSENNIPALAAPVLGPVFEGEIYSSFDDYVKAAESGNAELGYALSKRLLECAALPQERQQDLQSVRADENPELTAAVRRLQDEECSGLTPLQLSQQPRLLALAAQHGSPQAKLSLALASVDSLEAASLAYRAQSPEADRAPTVGDQTALANEVKLLAQSGNLRAMELMARMYANGLVIASDSETYSVYQAVLNHDWSLPAAELVSQMSQWQVPEDRRQQLIQRAVAMFESCCANRKKEWQ